MRFCECEKQEEGEEKRYFDKSFFNRRLCESYFRLIFSFSHFLTSLNIALIFLLLSLALFFPPIFIICFIFKTIIYKSTAATTDVKKHNNNTVNFPPFINPDPRLLLYQRLPNNILLRMFQATRLQPYHSQLLCRLLSSHPTNDPEHSQRKECWIVSRNLAGSEKGYDTGGASRYYS